MYGLLRRALPVIAVLCAACTGQPTGSTSAHPPPSPTRVQVEGGIVAGVASGDVLSFKGIPYAAPPVGRLRWEVPQPVEPWAGVRDAGSFGHDCVQQPIPGDAAASGATFDEDCLVLNVWRPASIPPGTRLPVMVWIHGGGFLNGGSSAPIFDGSAFARAGIVLVSFNYRLGRLGFFAHPALTAAQPRPTANFGLLDQLAALRWVQRNVAAFGGDPGAVTIVGESAGGISVMHLLTWPEAHGLFHRAMVLSGGGRSFLLGLRRLAAEAARPSAEESGRAFARSRGIEGEGAAALEALRALPAAQVNGDMSMIALVTQPDTYVGGPVFDGTVIAGLPGDVIRGGAAAYVPLIIGTTSADLPVTYPPDRTRPLDVFGPDRALAQRLYDPDGRQSARQLADAVAVDMTMHEPARFVARQWTARGAPAWLYRFSYVAQSQRESATGAAHSTELPYLFDTVDVRYPGAATAQDRATATSFHRYVANFVRYGDPNGSGLPQWPRQSPGGSELMDFTLDAGPRWVADPWQQRLDLVERVLER